MTKGELFEMLEGVPDDTEITVCPVPNVINWTNHIQRTMFGFDKVNRIVLALEETTVHFEEPDIKWFDERDRDAASGRVGQGRPG